MAVGRTYDDGPDPDTIWIDLYDTWRAESAWEHEPNPIEHSAARGDAWDAAVTGPPADPWARQMWGTP